MSTRAKRSFLIAGAGLLVVAAGVAIMMISRSGNEPAGGPAEKIVLGVETRMLGETVMA